MRARDFLSREEQQRLIDAIIAAEKRTSGEIRIHIERKCPEDPKEGALRTFHKLHMEKTAQRNAVLIYVACESRRFAVLGDKGIDKIDTLIITHFDKDHVGGAARVVKKFPIGTVYVPDYKSDSDEYLSFIQNASNAGTAITQIPVTEQREWNYDGAAFTLYAPQKTDYGQNEENDFSLCLFMQYDNIKYLFTGDAEEARQREIMDLNLGTVDFLKFPYHGHYLKTTEDFLNACKPKSTVVCCSEKENADDKTVETLKNRGIEAYYTTGGNVTVRTDGSTMVCSQG